MKEAIEKYYATKQKSGNLDNYNFLQGAYAIWDLIETAYKELSESEFRSFIKKPLHKALATSFPEIGAEIRFCNTNKYGVIIEKGTIDNMYRVLDEDFDALLYRTEYFELTGRYYDGVDKINNIVAQLKERGKKENE